MKTRTKKEENKGNSGGKDSIYTVEKKQAENEYKEITKMGNQTRSGAGNYSNDVLSFSP